MPSKSTSIAIVGCGSVGTSFLRQLAEAAPNDIDTVLIIEPNQTPGAGDAYQPDTASNLLNTRVSSMSPIASDPGHFQRWIEANRPRWQPMFPDVEPSPQSFVPRALFGLYLREVFVEAVGMLRGIGITVQHLPSRVLAIRKQRKGYELQTSQGRALQADRVVLSIGNLENNDWDHLRPSPNYFPSPYPCTKLTERIGAGKSVCILGSSLSAIDAAVSLADAGHTGKIFMVSRNGRLPSVRGEQNLKRTPKLLARERVQELATKRAGGVSLDEFAQLLLRELELCDGESPDLSRIMRRGEGPHRYLDAEIECKPACNFDPCSG